MQPGFQFYVIVLEKPCAVECEAAAHSKKMSGNNTKKATETLVWSNLIKLFWYFLIIASLVRDQTWASFIATLLVKLLAYSDK